MGEGPCRANLVAHGSPPLPTFLVLAHHYPFLPLSTGSAARPSGHDGALHAGGGGVFAPCEALLRRVVGVSHPCMAQFPPIGGAASAVRGGVAPTSQTTSVKNAEKGLLVAKWSAFWVQRCLAWRASSYANPLLRVLTHDIARKPASESMGGAAQARISGPTRALEGPRAGHRVNVRIGGTRMRLSRVV